MSSPATMSAPTGQRSFLTAITRPARALPPGACDTHAHVFGPYERFALSAERSYTPPPSPFEDYLRMLDTAGMTRGVLVHPSAYGFDPGAMLDALARAPRRLRGIAVADRLIDDETLADLDARGVRGLRFTETGGGGTRYTGAVGLTEFDALAPRLRELGWHAVVWAPCARLAIELPRLLGAGIPVVLDHMGMLEVARGVGGADFQALLAHLRGGALWLKLSLPRVSQRFPDYDDLRPFHDALLHANPDRLLWGSDWPFLRLAESTPAVGQLIDLFDAWTDDEELRRKVFVDNPAALYGFDGVKSAG